MTGRIIAAALVLVLLVSAYLGHKHQAVQIQLLTTQLSAAQADAAAARQQLAAANTAATADQAALQADCSARLAAANTAQQLTRRLAHVDLVARPVSSAAPAAAAPGLPGGAADPALAVQPRDRDALRGAVLPPFFSAGPQGQQSAVPGAADDQVAGLAAPGGLAPAGPAAEDGAGGPDLSVAAVGLWNAALLAGGPQPSGWPAAPACGADAAPGQPGAPDALVDAETCAQSAGLSLAHAWANHITNAASCATDRARLAALQQAVRGRWPTTAGDAP